eukprot:2985593-Alexandrium_andersonii.AAC.1
MAGCTPRPTPEACSHKPRRRVRKRGRCPAWWRVRQRGRRLTLPALLPDAGQGLCLPDRPFLTAGAAGPFNRGRRRATSSPSAKATLLHAT